MCPWLALLVRDSSCWCGESALMSAGWVDVSVLDTVDLSLLDSGRVSIGSFSVLTWGLPLRHLRAASL